MAKENSLECPNCGEKMIVKPRVCYEVFRGARQPDGVCGNCGAFYWKRPEETIPSIILKQKDESETWNWFEAFEQEEKRRRPSLPKGRN
ncbi:MAG: hypothetical protein Q8M00_01690 [bacterium]|nr:hypothetical protein [bacterium]